MVAPFDASPGEARQKWSPRTGRSLLSLPSPRPSDCRDRPRSRPENKNLRSPPETNAQSPSRKTRTCGAIPKRPPRVLVLPPSSSQDHNVPTTLFLFLPGARRERGDRELRETRWLGREWRWRLGGGKEAKGRSGIRGSGTRIVALRAASLLEVEPLGRRRRGPLGAFDDHGLGVDRDLAITGRASNSTVVALSEIGPGALDTPLRHWFPGEDRPDICGVTVHPAGDRVALELRGVSLALERTGGGDSSFRGFKADDGSRKSSDARKAPPPSRMTGGRAALCARTRVGASADGLVAGGKAGRTRASLSRELEVTFAWGPASSPCLRRGRTRAGPSRSRP